MECANAAKNNCPVGKALNPKITSNAEPKKINEFSKNIYHGKRNFISDNNQRTG